MNFFLISNEEGIPSQEASLTLHLLHIPKTGGTALRHTLCKCRNECKYHIKICVHATKLFDIPVGESVIFSIRDPISRFVSGFYCRYREGRPLFNSPLNPKEIELFNIFPTPCELAESLSSDSEKIRKQAQLAMRRIGHIRTSYWDWFKNKEYLLSRQDDIFFILRQEHLESDFAFLIEKLGLPEKIHLPSFDDPTAHRMSEDMGFDTSLSEKARENLKKWYAKEYEFMDFIEQIRREKCQLPGPERDKLEK